MSGLSLIEILISTLILGIIVAGIFAVLNIADMTWNSDMGLLEIQQQVRQAIDGMIREIRQCRPQDITIKDEGSRVDFLVPDISNSISYYILNNQILREHPAGTQKILANDITDLKFCCVGGISCTDCLNAGILQIRIRADKTVKGRPLSFSLKEQTRLRN